jgi:hypothetical protein
MDEGDPPSTAETHGDNPQASLAIACLPPAATQLAGEKLKGVSGLGAQPGTVRARSDCHRSRRFAELTFSEWHVLRKSSMRQEWIFETMMDLFQRWTMGNRFGLMRVNDL